MKLTVLSLALLSTIAAAPRGCEFGEGMHVKKRLKHVHSSTIPRRTSRTKCRECITTLCRQCNASPATRRNVTSLFTSPAAIGRLRKCANVKKLSFQQRRRADKRLNSSAAGVALESLHRSCDRHEPAGAWLVLQQRLSAQQITTAGCLFHW